MISDFEEQIILTVSLTDIALYVTLHMQFIINIVNID